MPLRVLADNGREFDAKFLHGLEIDGSYHDTTAAYAPHQNGMTERRGQTWKRAFEKTLESVAPATRQEVDEVIESSDLCCKHSSEGWRTFTLSTCVW